MKCKAFRQDAMNRSDYAEGAKAAEARTHLESCPTCGDWLERQRRVSSSLDGLAAAMAQERAGARVEAELLREFRRFSVDLHDAPSPFRHWLWIPAATAACAVVVFGIVMLQRPIVTTPPTRAAAIAPPRLVREPRPTTPSPRAARPAGRSVAPKATPAPPPEVALGADEDAGVSVEAEAWVSVAEIVESDPAAPFVPLRPGDATASLEGGHVVQVQISPTALRSAGIPAGTENGLASVRADVVVGQDGIARAIRLVREKK